ncbi:MAG: O-antigen polymerase [Bacteroidales bacterium]
MSIISVITLACSVYLFRRAAGSLSLKRPNIISIFFWILMIFQYIGSYLLITGIVKNNWWINRAENIEFSLKMAHISLLLVLVLLPITIIICFKFLKFNPKKETERVYTDGIAYIHENSMDRNAKYMFLVLTLLTLLCLAYLLYSVRDIPIVLAVLSANQELVEITRVSAIKGNFLIKLINGIVGNWIAPLLTLSLYAYYWKTKKNYYLILFLMNLFITCFFLIYRTEKAPLALFLITLFFLYSLMKGKINLKKASALAFIIIAFLSIQYIIFLGAGNFGNAIENLISRIFVSQHAGSVLAFDYFPIHEAYLGGKLFLPFSSFLFGEEEVQSFALRIMDYYNPVASKIGAAGYMSTLFVAEGYANWGWMGIFLSILIVGIFLSLYTFLMYRVRQHPISLALLSFLSIQLPFRLNSGLRIAIYSPELLLTIFLMVSIIIFARRYPKLLIRII